MSFRGKRGGGKPGAILHKDMKKGRGKRDDENLEDDSTFATRAQPYARADHRGRGRGGRGGRGGHQPGIIREAGETITVLITGFPVGTPQKDVLDFLRQSATSAFHFSAVKMEEEGLFLTFDSAQESGVRALTALDKLLFKGIELSVKKVQAKRKTAGKCIEQLVDHAYNPEAKYMNLSKLENRPELRDMRGGTTGVDLNTKQFCTVLFQCVREKFPDVQTVDISGNKIKTLNSVGFALRENLPGLQNISIGNNPIVDVAELDHLRALPILQVMIGEDVPFRKKLVESMGVERYRIQVRKRFPYMTHLDGEVVTMEMNQPVALPPYCGNFVHPPENGTLVTSIIQQLFNAMDTSRPSLVDLYTDTSSFSLTVLIPQEAMGKQATRDKSYDPKEVSGLRELFMHNRNLLKVKSDTERVDRLKYGRLDIAQFFQKEFPKTKHEFGGEDFVADSFTGNIPGMMFLTLHGSFKDLDSGFMRSYDRTLILVPNDANALKGLPPVAILNDQLLVRLHAPAYLKKQEQLEKKKAQQAATLGVPPPGVPATPPHPVGAGASSVVVQGSPATPADLEGLIQRMCMETGMNPVYSRQCLEGNGWNYAAGLDAFRRLQSAGQIPADAFAR